AHVVVASIETSLKYADTHVAETPAQPARRRPPAERGHGPPGGAARVVQAALKAWNGHDTQGYGAPAERRVRRRDARRARDDLWPGGSPAGNANDAGPVPGSQVRAPGRDHGRCRRARHPGPDGDAL